jgi:hypothetical protein
MVANRCSGDVGQILSHLTRFRSVAMTTIPARASTKSRDQGFVLHRILAILSRKFRLSDGY